MSVDGVNAVTGESASPDQSGYVLEPGGYVNIQGWRKDLSRTAAFYFSDPGDSYAARTGRPNDLGVIGVALFRELPVEQPAWLSQDRQSAAPASRERAEADAAGEAKASRAAGATASAPAMQQPSLGTGHGRGEYSPVQQVEFERASTQPDEMIAIRYERRETLVAMGVIAGAAIQLFAPPPRSVPGRTGFRPRSVTCAIAASAAPPNTARRMQPRNTEQEPRTDEALMRAYGRGDARAFEELYARHKAATYRYFLRHAGGDAATRG